MAQSLEVRMTVPYVVIPGPHDDDGDDDGNGIASARPVGPYDDDGGIIGALPPGPHDDDGPPGWSHSVSYYRDGDDDDTSVGPYDDDGDEENV